MGGWQGPRERAVGVLKGGVDRVAGIQISTRSRSVKNAAVLGSSRKPTVSGYTSPRTGVFQGSPFEHLPPGPPHLPTPPQPARCFSSKNNNIFLLIYNIKVVTRQGIFSKIGVGNYLNAL